MHGSLHLLAARLHGPTCHRRRRRPRGYRERHSGGCWSRRRGGHGEYILLLQLVAESDVLGIGVLLDIGLLIDSLVGLTLLDLHGLEDGGAVRTVLIEHGGNGGAAGHLEGADPVLERDSGGIVIGVIEDGEAVGEIPVGGRGLDCDRLADIHRNGLGVVVPADKRQAAVLGIGEGDGCRLS